eukprot:jgi/Picre1/29694/NNA_005077.t1
MVGDTCHFIRDDIDDIGDAVSSLSAKCDAVLSCGGLGPTLDDVTMKAVAKAIGRKIVTSASLEKKIKAHFGDHVTKFHLKMAEVPDGPETILIDYMLRDGRPSPYPLVRCRNIYILPGVPSIVEQKWSAVRETWQTSIAHHAIDRTPSKALIRCPAQKYPFPRGYSPENRG